MRLGRYPEGPKAQHCTKKCQRTWQDDQLEGWGILYLKQGPLKHDPRGRPDSKRRANFCVPDAIVRLILFQNASWFYSACALSIIMFALCDSHLGNFERTSQPCTGLRRIEHVVGPLGETERTHDYEQTYSSIYDNPPHTYTGFHITIKRTKTCFVNIILLLCPSAPFCCFVFCWYSSCLFFVRFFLFVYWKKNEACLLVSLP